MEALQRNTKEMVDKAEELIVKINNPVDCPLTHRFTPGLYSREIFMPEGTIITSKIHKTEHQFIVSQGVCSVYNALTDTTELITAPYHGITMPGTRRVIYIFEDCLWTTFHSTQLTTVEEIENDILENYTNPLLEGIKNKEVTQ